MRESTRESSGGWLQAEAEGLGEVHTWVLSEPVKYPTSFLALEGAVSTELVEGHAGDHVVL